MSTHLTTGAPPTRPQAMAKKRTTAEFIEVARATHGDRYDYSKAVYTTAHAKVIIICPEHGEFTATPGNHLRGKKCPHCANINRSVSQRFTTATFIEQAKACHGDRYDYSKAQYINARTPVTMICPEHGEFSQAALNHVRGVGCKACGVEQRAAPRRTGREAFIKKAQATHGRRYIYSDVRYSNVDTPVAIQCRQHGTFMQTPLNHLAGKGCTTCGRIKTNRCQRDMTAASEAALQVAAAVFFTRAQKRHGDKYDYSKSVYRGSKKRMRIKCPIHGITRQYPFYHLKGEGCKKCSSLLSAQDRAITTEEFIERANATHAGRYSYPNARYVNAHTPIRILCPEHGEFKQAAGTHMAGRGCPSCATTGFNPARPGYLYLLFSEYGHAVKIGISNTPKARFRAFNSPRQQKKRGFKFTVEGCHRFEDGQQANDLEATAHRLFKADNLKLTGFDGATEWFAYTPEIVQWFEAQKG